jgi:hypothetical protein
MKRSLEVLALAAFIIGVGAVAAQSPEPPISDTRLTVHTLLREDIFAGFITDNDARFARGEKNIQVLLQQRPSQKPNLLAWSGGATLYRAVRAYEAGRQDEFLRDYRQAVDLFSHAQSETGANEAVPAVVGGSSLLFADRLPKEYRAAAWQQAYDSYKILWKQQGGFLEKLPVHMRGELLAGLAESSARTGHKDELDGYLDKIVAVLGGTPYEPVAREWKKNPEAASTGSIACMTCHEAGRLGARLTALDSK